MQEDTKIDYIIVTLRYRNSKECIYAGYGADAHADDNLITGSKGVNNVKEIKQKDAKASRNSEENR